MSNAEMSEKTYRSKVSEVFERLLKALDKVDPDVAEAELSQGTLTILVQGAKIIISPQPPVQQIWLAHAAKGKALHFSWDDTLKQWRDDKNLGMELIAYTQEILTQSAGKSIYL